MNLVTFDQFDNQSIRVTEDGRYSVYDVIRFCGKKNQCEVWKRLCREHSELVTKCQKDQFPGRGQRKTPVATKAVIEEILTILGYHPEQVHVMSNKFYPRTEEQIIRVLVAAFHDQEPCTQFFCQGYRIDIYLAKPRIAVECDENSHRAYDSNKEKRRQSIIKSALGCSFVRFDPYVGDFNLGKVIAEIRGLL